MAVTQWRNRAAISISGGGRMPESEAGSLQQPEEGCRKTRLEDSNNRRKGAGKRGWESPTTGGRVPESAKPGVKGHDRADRLAGKSNHHKGFASGKI